MELMIVLVIIGIVTGVVVAEMGGTFQEELLRSAARQVVSVCGVAYSQAVSSGHAQRVAFNLDTGAYQIERRRGREFVPVKAGGDERGQIDRRIRVEIHLREENQTQPDAVTFYADGTADACQMRLTDREGDTRVVVVDPITGRVRVSEKAPEEEP